MIRVALIGYGYWGPNLARNLHQLPQSTFAACCDLDAGRLAKVAALYPGVKTTTRLEDIWEAPDIEAVVIATPARTHYNLARQALLAGKHVLVEKPIAMSSRETGELIALAEERRRVLMVGHTFEYNPAVLKIKEMMDAGTLGDIYYLYSTRVNLGRVQQDLNALWSIAPHDISIMNFLLDAMPLEVSARGAKYLSGLVEDVVFADLVYPDGVIAHIHASWLDPSKVRKMTIVGSRKMIVYDDIDPEGKVRLYDKGADRINGSQIYGEFQYKLRTGDIYIPKIDLTEPLYLECAHFVECILEGRRPRTDGVNGLRVVRVLEAAERSMAKNGAPEPVEPVSP
ncbi:MAG: Gfo/Idh/MocA family protein [Anaerolineae bacterium]